MVMDGEYVKLNVKGDELDAIARILRELKERDKERE